MLNFLACVAFAQEPAGPLPDTPNGSQLVSLMLRRYNEANTVSGTVQLVQRAQNQSITVQTELQYERPSKIYIKQVQTGANARQALIVSDGVRFAYDRPEGVLGRERFVEPVKQGNSVMTVAEMYNAAQYSLVSKSPALDMIIARVDDLRTLRSQWGSINLRDERKVNGVTVYTVVASKRSVPNAAPSGSMEMHITEAGDLVRYVEKEMIMIPRATREPFPVQSIYTINVQVNGPVNASYFAVR
jgi:outer membrane lipoprotein-sorting protein